MESFVTLEKQDPSYRNYLDGTFSTDYVAIPLQTLNLNTTVEKVTFNIIPKDQIHRPYFLIIWSQALKLRTFLYVLFPLFVLAVKNLIAHRVHDPLTMVSSTVGILLVFAASNLRNEYIDHMKGYDRMIDGSGSGVIQKGWLTAIQLKRVANILLITGLLFAIPALLAVPKLWILVLASLVLGLTAVFQQHTAFKYKIGGEFAMFFLLGPLLAVGYQVSMGSVLDFDALWFGISWGWLILFLVHLKNFANLIQLSQAHFENTIVALGFDRARRWIAIWWLGFVVCFWIYHYLYAGTFWGWHLGFAFLLLSARFIIKLKQLKSPAGSELQSVYEAGYRLYLIVVGTWTLVNLWYILNWSLIGIF